MSLSEQWRAAVVQANQEWQSNKRLQYITVLSVILFGLWCLVQLESLRLKNENSAQAAFTKLQDVSQTAKEKRWPERAVKSKAALKEIRQKIWIAGSEGEAQATLRDWLELQARNEGLVIDRITVELGGSSVGVLLRPVQAEIQGVYEVGVWQRFIQRLSVHKPSIVIEYEEINFNNPRKLKYKLSITAWFELS